MKVYICNTFEGHNPVGTAAVVIAENKEQARTLLHQALLDVKLPGLTDSDIIAELTTAIPNVVILNDGDL